MIATRYYVLGHGEDEVVHIAGEGISTLLTLCGYCDVPAVETLDYPTCTGCLRHLEYCKKLRLPQKPKKDEE